MKTLNTVALAQRLCSTGTEYDSLIVVDAYNNGGASNWSSTFPSIIDTVHEESEPLTLVFETQEEARTAFTKLCHDAVDGGSQLVTGTITLIMPDEFSSSSILEGRRDIETISFDLTDDKEYPAFEDGALVHHMRLDRL